MPDLSGFGKLLVFLGGALALVGFILMRGGFSWLGRLPGDIYMKRDNFTFYFPLTTSILVSLVLSFVLYLLSKR